MHGDALSVLIYINKDKEPEIKFSKTFATPSLSVV